MKRALKRDNRSQTVTNEELIAAHELRIRQREKGAALLAVLEAKFSGKTIVLNGLTK
ncbi:hypothetical protein [Dyadobacter sp. CY343]|uniref:hypothetical protein n=1 Tax=Dyadobacter sp. CY343 TaxID=2907299 RepID=UPI001F3A2F86|nr:hypothetical protein [Dyadobacter sp. CY343]MCE7062260.1 hypothetical protein [Dyadobacter sp. CY343]